MHGILSNKWGAVLGLFLLTLSARAQSTWNFSGSGTWSDSARWNGGVPNASDATAIFDNTVAGGNKTITVVSATIGELALIGNASGTTVTTFTGGTLTFNSSAAGGAFLRFQGSNRATISSVISLGSDLTIQAATDLSLPTFSGSLNVSGSILGNGHDLTVNAGQTVSFINLSGAITDGTGAGTRLLKTGGGALTLSSTANTYTGGTEITAGSVTVNLANTTLGMVIGSAFVNAPNLVITATGLSGTSVVTLNNSVMQSGLGCRRQF